MDFGARRGSTAVRALERMTLRRGWPWWRPSDLRPWAREPFSAFLLSHPHADHYNGLLKLAATARDERIATPLLGEGAAFYHPRLPEDPEAGEVVLRLVALNRVLSGIPELALGQAIAACATGPVTRQPLSRGDSLTLAGESFDVLWPPQTLPSQTKARLRTLIRRFDALAEQAAERDDPRLKQTLESLRQRAVIGIEAALYNVPDSTSDERWVGFEDRDLSDLPGAADEDDGSMTESLRALRRAISAGANLLSLAVTTVDRRYIFLGDLDESLHAEVAVELIGHEPEVVSSAHHGTHFGPALGQLRSRYVISSVGAPLAGDLRREYGTMGMHLRTDRAGDIVAWIGDCGTHVWTRTTQR